jgi:hypothetical protein
MRRVLAFGLFAAGCGPEAIAVARAQEEPAPTVVAPTRPHELRGDPAAAEREIFAVADAELAEDLLLGLPGSHGLPVSAQAMGRVPIAEGGHAIGTPEGGTLEGSIPRCTRAAMRRDRTRRRRRCARCRPRSVACDRRRASTPR